MKCRHCRAPLSFVFLDLGSAPPSNAYLCTDQLRQPESWFPLRVFVCSHCWLVQTEDHLEAPQLFTDDYAYFSSFSATWLEHAERYVEAMISRFQLNAQSVVIEVAANDGYLLQYVARHGIGAIGIEPTRATAEAARRKGLTIIEAFFGRAFGQQLAAEGRHADLMIANNVLAHVPDMGDFVAGFHAVLKPHGVVTFEFPHLLRLRQGLQFDTVYHEHYSYLSLTSVVPMLVAAGLEVFDVEELSTHGGSLRVFAQRSETKTRARSEAVMALLDQERAAGMTEPGFYRGFQAEVIRIKHDLLAFLLEARRTGRRVAGYGAAAKGNTLLNYAGVRSDLLPYVADRNPAKQGSFLPGSRIPVLPEAHLWADRPDFVLLLPWNLRAEISAQLAGIRAWGGQFVTAIPRISVW